MECSHSPQRHLADLRPDVKEAAEPIPPNAVWTANGKEPTVDEEGNNVPVLTEPPEPPTVEQLTLNLSDDEDEDFTMDEA